MKQELLVSLSVTNYSSACSWKHVFQGHLAPYILKGTTSLVVRALPKLALKCFHKYATQCSLAKNVFTSTVM